MWPTIVGCLIIAVWIAAVYILINVIEFNKEKQDGNEETSSDE